MIFRGYLLSLDRMQHLTNRLYATTLIDNQISDIQRVLRAYKTLPVEMNITETAQVGGKEIEFRQIMDISAVEDYVDVFKLDISLLWNEGDKEIKFSRQAYISDFHYLTGR